MFQVVTVIFLCKNIEKEASYSRFSRGPQRKGSHAVNYATHDWLIWDKKYQKDS